MEAFDPWIPLLAGVAGGAHCLGMCGPIAAAGGAAGTRLAPFLYLAGKTGSYVLLVAIASLGAGILAGGLPLARPVLAVLAGLTFVSHGIALLAEGEVPRVTRSPLVEIAGRLAAAVPGGFAAPFVLGCISGLLPCGLSWSVAVHAGATLVPPAAFLSMVLFSLGTAPVLLLPILAGGRLPRNPRLRWLTGALALVLGLGIVVRGLAPWLRPAGAASSSALEGWCGPAH